MQLHWKNPGRPDGSAWVAANGGKPGTGPYNIAGAIKPGTTEHQQVMDDLKRHADFLQQMLDARIPILWRPLHEIEGGWFWWTDKEQPENTAALWRTVKYEEVYLHDYESVWSAHEHLGRYFPFYNEDRPHQALDCKTPAEAYWGGKLQRAIHLKQLA